MGVFAVQPVFPASTVSFTNTYGRNAIVVISGGSVTVVLVNGVSAGLGGTYTVPAGATIAVTYTGTPAWTWNTPLNMSALQPPANDFSSANTGGMYGYGAAAPDEWQSLPYGPHGALAQPGLGAAVSN
jgi:hypothetical protein